MSENFTIRSRRVNTPHGLRPASIAVEDGRILSFGEHDARPRGLLIDGGDLVLMSGLVDAHVHANDPGRTDWESFETATRAAAAGGVTTIVDMPLNSSPVTTTAGALEAKRKAARGRLWVDAGLWGGVIPGNGKELEPMVRMGARGCKAFLIDSGLDEFPPVDEKELREAMKILAALNAPLLIHAELDDGHREKPGNNRAYARYLSSRPPSWEAEAAKMAARLCRETGCRTHIVHLSAAEALPVVRDAKAKGAPLTAETCPHYLTFCAEEIPEGRTEFKCAPPIRGRENREKLWAALRDGTLDFVASDHSPCAPELKKLAQGDFESAWGGIASLQFLLPALWTEAEKRGFGVEDVAGWLSAAPAAHAGLESKGKLAPGADADFVLWDPAAEFEVVGPMVRHLHPITPYRGRRLRGAVRRAFVRGVEVHGEAAVVSPAGTLLESSSWNSRN